MPSHPFEDLNIARFAVAMIFAIIANGCAFFVLGRMRTLGFSVALWRWRPNDFKIFRAYWNIAPVKGWSRRPVIIGFLAALAAFAFFISSVE
jgi:hypothetical protein